MPPARFRIRDAEDPSDSRARAHSEYGVRNSFSGIRSTEFALRNSLFGIRSSGWMLSQPLSGRERLGCPLRDSGFAMRKTLRTRGLEPIRSTEYGIRSPEFVLRNSLFGIRSSGSVLRDGCFPSP